ncbi:hypothetical protein [Fimbriiglobus ruber]|uniref:hypothetical protein n=1 Tax=Fimbriiglobus ruber TaxID=1908690 RepID=UPI00117A37C0|nr:hypothetical protein [Fimbriiglobus ruber]
MTEQITHQRMLSMTSAELRLLLQRQKSLKSRLEDQRSSVTAAIGTVTTNIHNIKSRIRAVEDAQPVDITDHAVVRYLQRVRGVDIDAVRTELDSDNLRESVKRCPTGRHYLDGVTYVVQDKTLVTVIYDEEPQP